MQNEKCKISEKGNSIVNTRYTGVKMNRRGVGRLRKKDLSCFENLSMNGIFSIPFVLSSSKDSDRGSQQPSRTLRVAIVASLWLLTGISSLCTAETYEQLVAGAKKEGDEIVFVAGANLRSEKGACRDRSGF